MPFCAAMNPMIEFPYALRVYEVMVSESNGTPLSCALPNSSLTSQGESFLKGPLVPDTAFAMINCGRASQQRSWSTAELPLVPEVAPIQKHIEYSTGRYV